MSQMKVYEFAKEVGIETIALMDKIKKWELPIKSHMSSIDNEMADTIKQRLSEEDNSGKKKTKKKAVAKKTAKKKAVAAGPKAKKKVSSTVVRKTASDTEPEATASSKKVVRKKSSSVIRRKAGAIEPVQETTSDELSDNVMGGMAAEVALDSSVENGAVEQAARESNGEPISGDTTAVASSESALEMPVEKKARGKIVGRMDPNRIMSKPMSGTGQRTPAAAPRSTGPRNIRTGFVAPNPIEMPLIEPERRVAEKDKHVKKKAGAGGKDLPVQNFTATEFRKREVIFQPKKKRVPGFREAKKTQITTPKASKRVVEVHGSIKVSDLADQMSVKAPQVIRMLMNNGVMANMNTELDFDTVSLIVGEFGFEAKNTFVSVEEMVDTAAFGDLDAEKVSRPPVVTVMGHVDHGKTTLLDSIRKANVAKGEAGGITQHIGAYKVALENGETVTFLDTPGHEAFTSMRARGANVTDIVIIVVAADDGAMPQTVEAINHAKAAKVPIVVAVNKIDKPGANPDRIKQQLAEYELVPEEWGGNTMFCHVSALKGEGVKELLEGVLLNAEVLELKVNQQRSGTGVVIESKIEKGRGPVANVLVQEGTVSVGQYFVAGTVTGRVRQMINDQGQAMSKAFPGDPISVTGLDGTPEAGDRFDICKDEKTAQSIAEQRRSVKETMEKVPTEAASIENIFAKLKAGYVKELSVILKSDVAGSAEAIKGMFAKAETSEVKIKVTHSAVGAISESDVLLASTTGGLVIGFNVRPDAAAQRLAKEKNVEIKTYSIIYELMDDMKLAMAGLLSPDIVEKVLGRAEVRETFSVPKIGTIAGCMVTDGKITRSSLVRLLRNGTVVYDGKLGSLRRFKDDAKEVASGYECGIGIENYNDLKVGDEIEAYIKEEVARELS